MSEQELLGEGIGEGVKIQESLVYVFKQELELRSSIKKTIGDLLKEQGNNPAYFNFCMRLQNSVWALVQNQPASFPGVSSESFMVNEESQVSCSSLGHYIKLILA